MECRKNCGACCIAPSINIWWTVSFSEFTGMPRDLRDRFKFRWAVAILCDTIQDVLIRWKKLSGFNTPSKANRAAFDRAVEEVYEAAHRLLHDLETQAPPKDRQTEAAKAKARSAERFAKA